jgi:hypothetical protein
MLSRIYYAVATTALVATMGVLEGAQHAQSLKFRMNQSPENHVLKVQTYSTGEKGDIEILVTHKETYDYGTYYYGTYITKEFLGRKFEPNQTSFPGQSLVAIQNDSGLAVTVPPYSITLFTLLESGRGAAIGYNNPSIIPSECEFQKAVFAEAEKERQEMKSFCESLEGKSRNEILDACAEAGVNVIDESLRPASNAAAAEEQVATKAEAVAAVAADA